MRNLKWIDAPVADANDDELDDDTRLGAVSKCLFETELKTKSDLENLASFLRDTDTDGVEWETSTLADGG